MYPFNRALFNRTHTIDAHFNVSIASSTLTTTTLNTELVFSSVLYHTEIELSSPFIREIYKNIAIESATKLLAAYGRERIHSTDFKLGTEVKVSAVYSHVESAQYAGVFSPGDRIVIDTKARTVTLNGVNVLDRLAGDFISLVAGDNVITYEDQEPSRNILTRITYRDQYLY